MLNLSKIDSVRNVFMIGNYDPKKFTHFIEDLLAEFSFQTIQFIQDDIPKNEAGVIFKYRNRILKDNPYVYFHFDIYREYLFVMRYKIVSSFPF